MTLDQNFLNEIPFHDLDPEEFIGLFLKPLT